MTLHPDRRPHGFMTLGTVPGNETVLVRVAEVAAVCDGVKGSLLTLRSGQQTAVRESLSEVAEAMNAEATD